MKFRTELDISPFSFSISHGTPTVLLGSCFSNNIGSKLQDHYYPTLVNPHGIVFNPVSLARLVANSLTNKTFKLDDADNVAKNGNFYSYHHHSQISSNSKNGLLRLIERKNEELKAELAKAKTLFITLGTSWVYELKSTGQVVANCHKTPSINFNKRLLNVAEIENSLRLLVELCKGLSPSLQIVFTVSPVRHIKDGIAENQISKSLLFSALNSVVPFEEKCHYFPSYELVMDDLRDYRFYEKDLIHPNEQAIDYIWEKFEKVFFNCETLIVNKQIVKLKAALRHKVMSGDNEELKKFVSASVNLCNNIESKADINLAAEKQYFQNLIT